MRRFKIGKDNLGQMRLAVRRCRRIRWLAIGSLFICAFVQLLIEPSSANVISVLMVLLASFITFHLVIRARIWRTAPLPTLIVALFNAGTMSGALVAQTLTWRPLVFNLQVPEITFTALALFQGSLLIALFLFISSSTLRVFGYTVNSRVFKPMGLMQPPSMAQLWVMGALGLGAMAWKYFAMSPFETQYGDVEAKFIDSLLYFAFAPFLIPVLSAAFPNIIQQKIRNKWLFIAYFFVLLIVAIAQNSRASFTLGLVNLGMAGILLFLLGQLHISRRLRRRLVVGAVLLMVISPAVSDLATAMVLVRDERGTISSTALIQRTFDAFQDKQALEHYRRAGESLAGTGVYEEYYISNPFLARFVVTKFVDNNLSYEWVRKGHYASELWEVTLNKIAVLFPTPVLRFFRIDLDKRDWEFSIGTAMCSLQYGFCPSPYNAGSSLAHGLGLMGSWVYLFVIPLFLTVFLVLQSLTGFVGGVVVISPVLLLQLILVYILGCSDSLLDLVGLMLRILPQNILLYWVVFHASRWGCKISFRMIAYCRRSQSTLWLHERWQSQVSTGVGR